MKAQRLLLEYDDERSGGFEPLREVPDDKTVVLGLVTTKESRLEPVGQLLSRVREASQFFPSEQLAVSTQCGFSSSIIGNRLSLHDQTQKLRTVVETAQAIWG